MAIVLSGHGLACGDGFPSFAGALVRLPQQLAGARLATVAEAV